MFNAPQQRILLKSKNPKPLFVVISDKKQDSSKLSYEILNFLSMKKYPINIQEILDFRGNYSGYIVATTIYQISKNEVSSCVYHLNAYIESFFTSIKVEQFNNRFDIYDGFHPIHRCQVDVYSVRIENQDFNVSHCEEFGSVEYVYEPSIREDGVSFVRVTWKSRSSCALAIHELEKDYGIYPALVFSDMKKTSSDLLEYPKSNGSDHRDHETNFMVSEHDNYNKVAHFRSQLSPIQPPSEKHPLKRRLYEENDTYSSDTKIGKTILKSKYNLPEELYRSLYLSSFKDEITPRDVERELGRYGNITEVKYKKDRSIEDKIGSAFITFSTPDEARQAFRALNSQELSPLAASNQLSVRWSDKQIIEVVDLPRNSYKKCKY
jgi:hypothetical protein